MLKKYGLVTLAFLALPISYVGAAPTLGAAPAEDDTIVVDRNELMDVLRGVAAREMRKQYRPTRNARPQRRGYNYRPSRQGQTVPVYNSSSRRVEYIPVYVPQNGGQPIYPPYPPVQNLRPENAESENSKQTSKLQEQINQLQKQIETLSTTVQDPAVRQQVDSMARQLNNLRVQKDTVIMAAPLEETVTESAHNHDLVQPAQTVKVATFDTNIRQVFFEISSDALSKEAKHTLDELANVLKSNRKLKAELTGFSSPDGPKAFNRDLAMRRMNSVRTYLLKNGVHTNQVSALSYGIDKHSEMHTYARRVEVCVSL